jgi:hypothetical protein
VGGGGGAGRVRRRDRLRADRGRRLLVEPAHQLNPAAVERSYREQLAATDGAQKWPPPTGYRRDDGRFVLTDGRRRLVAALMLGMKHLLVAGLRAPG